MPASQHQKKSLLRAPICMGETLMGCCWFLLCHMQSSNAEAFTGDIVESELSKLLQDFKDKRLKQEKLQAPSFYEKAMENNASFLQFVGMLVVMSITIWTKNRAKRSSQVNTNPEENNPIAGQAHPDGEDAGADKED